ncbi:MAG TPA: hypothetical protein VN969_20445 [Streptosporangiaceae bacterium]|nr:hypothetical protein [Streptosporangiaceae bacterium]
MRRPVISALSLCVAAALSGCSAATPAAEPPSATTASSVTYTVVGNHPVLPNGSQDTHAQTPGSECDSATSAADEALGGRVADGFALAGFPVSAALLRHFLKGTGTEVDYPAGSAISRKALASSAFRAVDNEVKEAVLAQLKAGRTRVLLSVAQLPTVAFESKTSDLYWGFRGTQGLTVTGSIRHESGQYVGTLTYVIRDSYGFPVSDTLDGFGPPMRYLQTVCGAPQHAGGARWFPDTIALTVPFTQAP